MYWSKYNYLFESQKYGCLLYIAEKNTFAKLDKQTYDKLKELEEEKIAISDLDSEDNSTLQEIGAIVSDPNHYFNHRRLKYYYNAFDSHNLGLAIAPTTHCNFNCPYCYEEDHKAIYMTEEIEEGVIKFIRKHLRAERLYITWYGGEPLLGFDSIKRIIREVSKIDHLKLDGQAMTTNGYLLDEEKSVFFRDYPLSSIQITIDGTREYHDQRRTLAPNGLPTYDRIMSNIDIFTKYNPETQVIIRANLDQSNKDSFITLYREYEERWKKHGKFVYLNSAFVKDFSSVDENFALNGCRDLCFTKTDKVKFYADLSRKYNIKVDFEPSHCIGGCGATVLNYYVIGPEGELYKCWNDIGLKDKTVGHVLKDDFTNKQLLAKYLAGPSILDSEECRDCKLLPICDGGCIWARHKNLYEGGELELCSSRKDNMQEAFELYYEQLTEN